MSFLIGCMLIYHFDMGWNWYITAFVAYCCEWHQHYKYHRDLLYRIDRAEERLTPQPPDFD